LAVLYSPGNTAPGKEDYREVKIIRFTFTFFVTVADFLMPYVTLGCFYVPQSWAKLFSAYGHLRMICDELQIYINCTNISHSKMIRYIKGNSPVSDLKILCVHRELLFQSLFTFLSFWRRVNTMSYIIEARSPSFLFQTLAMSYPYKSLFDIEYNTEKKLIQYWQR